MPPNRFAPVGQDEVQLGVVVLESPLQVILGAESIELVLDFLDPAAAA